VGAVLGLADFERFVFVLCVLERYREHECALLLNCSASEVREARTQAIEELADFRGRAGPRAGAPERIVGARAVVRGTRRRVAAVR
jgi:DNA-directed RNA polymerase specialized sigma24 family protein